MLAMSMIRGSQRRDLTVVQPTQPFSPPKAFQEALVCHQQRRLREAEQLYNTVLKADGRHLGALYRLGLLCLHRADTMMLRSNFGERSG
jgi:hypothetical protein